MTFRTKQKVNEKIQSIMNTLDSVCGQEDTRSLTGEISVVSLFGDPGSRLEDICSPSFKLLTPYSESPSVLLPAKNTSIELLELSSSDNGSSVLKETFTETSLSELLSILAGWVSRCLEKIPKHPGNADLVDLKGYAEKEMVYGLGILKKLNKRVDTLLKSAECLPDPSTILAIRLEGEKNSVRDRLHDAGMKVKRRLEALEVEGTEDYGSFMSVCNDISKLNNDVVYVQELKVMTFSIITNTIINASENVMMLSLEIQNFRNKIREFCLAFDKVMRTFF